jgi:hypothetical protein
VKGRYIDPAPQGYVPVLERDEQTGLTLSRVFIPAKLKDNAPLMESDPTYVLRLKQSGSEALVRAWLEGDWSVIEGAFFDCWSPKMVLRPFAVPEDWTRFRSGDWGSARPFSFGWWAIVPDEYETPDGVWLPRGALVRYREWYGAKGPNEGLKLHAEDVGKGLAERERGEKVGYGVLDPAAFAEDGGPSIAERLLRGSGGKVLFTRADNKRVGERGAMGGWDQMRARMVGEEGRPAIYCFATCVDSIRTIPALQHDPDRPEDLDTDGEDHAGDDWRYGCMSRPYVKPTPVRKDAYHTFEGTPSGGIKSNLTIRELIERKSRREDD